MNNPDTLLVSFDNSHGTDVAVLIVGRKTPGDQVKIVNAFQEGGGGAKAMELYQKLVGEENKNA